MGTRHDAAPTAPPRLRSGDALVLAALWYRRETVEEYASQAVVGGGAVLRGKEQGKSSIAAVKVDRFTLQRQPNHK